LPKNQSKVLTSLITS